MKLFTKLTFKYITTCICYFNNRKLNDVYNPMNNSTNITFEHIPILHQSYRAHLCIKTTKHLGLYLISEVKTRLLYCRKHIDTFI